MESFTTRCSRVIGTQVNLWQLTASQRFRLKEQPKSWAYKRWESNSSCDEISLHANTSKCLIKKPVGTEPTGRLLNLLVGSGGCCHAFILSIPCCDRLRPVVTFVCVSFTFQTICFEFFHILIWLMWKSCHSFLNVNVRYRTYYCAPKVKGERTTLVNITDALRVSLSPH